MEYILGLIWVKHCFYRVNAVIFVAVLLTLSFMQGSHALAEKQIPTKYQVKAAFVYNFMKFITWPEESLNGPDDKFIVAVIGEGRINEPLAKIHGKLIDGYEIRFIQFNNEEDLMFSHVLFINSSDDYTIAQVVAKTRDKPTLTIAHSNGFLKIGGMINFVIDEESVRFEMNNEAAKRSGLKISAKLLRLAVRVYEN